MATPTFFYLLISGVCAALIVYLQYFYKTKISGKLRWLLAFLRFIAVFTGILLLFNLKIHIKIRTLEKPDLFVLADNSESIRFKKQDSVLIRLTDKIRNDHSLKEQFNIKSISFDKDVHFTDMLDFKGKLTNINKAIRLVSGLNENAAILLLTDGNQNTGKDYAYFQPEQKVFPVVLGDTTSYTDIRIAQVNVNPFVYEGNRFSVEVFSTHDGNLPAETTFQVFLKGKPVFHKILKFSKEKKSIRTQFKLTSGKKGTYLYKVALKPIANERNVQNNEKRFQVEVLNERSDVLLVYGVLHPDVGVWKQIVQKNNKRKLKIVDIRNFDGNTAKYSWVILYQPNADFDKVFSAIAKTGQNYLLHTGAHTDWPLLNTFQKGVKKTEIGGVVSRFPELNLNFNEFQVVDPGFATFPPLEAQRGTITFSEPQHILIRNKTEPATDKKEPMLAVSEIANQRKVYLFGENIFIWRNQSAANTDVRNKFEDFFESLVQYVQRKGKRSSIVLTSKPNYFSNEAVKIRAVIYNANYQNDTLSMPELQLRAEDKSFSKKYAMQLKNKGFETEINGLRPGVYNYTVKIPGNGRQKSGNFEVLNYNAEYLVQRSDLNSLQKLAESSGGRVYFPDQVGELIRILHKDPGFKPVQKETEKISPIINQMWLLLIIILSLSLEWLIRKYNGLI